MSAGTRSAARVQRSASRNKWMKLLRFMNDGKVALGVLRGSSIVPLHALKDDYPTMLSVIAAIHASSLSRAVARAVSAVLRCVLSVD